MKSKETKLFGFILIIISILLCSANAFAVPVLQTYSDGGVAATRGPDEETWFIAGPTLNLSVVAAYEGDVTDIGKLTLVASVPKGQTGSLSITAPFDEAPVLLGIGADVDILTNYSGKDGYLTKSALPDEFNNHFPFSDKVSNFVLFDLGYFTREDRTIHDYNASNGGSISAKTLSIPWGEEKDYTVDAQGFDYVHFDVYALVTKTKNGKTTTAWEINPGSHDVTDPPVTVPEPATLSLLGIGLLGFIFRKRII